MDVRDSIETAIFYAAERGELPVAVDDIHFGPPEVFVGRGRIMRGIKTTGRDSGTEVDIIAWPDGSFTVADVRPRLGNAP